MSYASLSGIARTGLGVLLAGVLVLLGPTSQALGVRSEEEPTRQRAAAGQESQTEEQAADSQAQAGAAPIKKDTTIRISKPDGTVVVKSGGSTWLRPGAKAPKAIRVTGSSSTGPQSVGAAAGPNRLHAPRPAHRRAVGAAEVASGAAARISSPTRGTVKVPANPVLLTAGRGGSGRSTGGGVVAGDEADTWLTGRGWVPGDDSGDDGAYISDLMADGFPVLEPGAGWDGPTDEPAPVGNPDDAGYDAKAIARWDVVPYQTISGDFYVGLLAFHMNGIDHVEISLDQGPWVSVTEMQVNPRTGVREYVACIPGDNPDLQTDRMIELRAVAYPYETGTPRLLDALQLYVNNQGTLTGPDIYVAASGDNTTGDGTAEKPFATIQKALNVCGADPNRYESTRIIVTQAGRYDIDQPAQPVRNTRWITIEPAASLSRDDVVIAAGSTADLVRPKTDHLRFHRVSIDFGDMYQMYKDDTQAQWYDNCRWFYSQGWAYSPPASLSPVRNVGYGGLFVTDCRSENSIYAFVTCNLVRNSQADHISGDVFQNSLMVIGCTATYVDGTVLSHHSDLLQYFGYFEDLIIYDVNAAGVKSTQNFFLDHANSTFTNCAFVNVAVQNEECDPPFSQLNSTQEHVLFLHVSNPGQRFVLRDDMSGSGKFVAKNVFFRNSVVERIQAAGYFDPIPEGVSIDHCHFSYNDPKGNDPTVGTIAILNSEGGQFDYVGNGASKLLHSAALIPGYSESETPDRGATPWGSPQ